MTRLASFLAYGLAALLTAALTLASPAQAQVDGPIAKAAFLMARAATPVNATPYATNLDPALLPHFRAAIAKTRAGTANTIILMEGDSTTAGVNGAQSGAANQYANVRITSFPYFLGQIGVSGLPTSNQNWWGDAGSAGHSSSPAAYNPLLTLNSGWAISGGTVFSLGNYALGNSTTTNTLDYAPTGSLNTCVIYAITSASQGTWQWSVDSGSISSAISNSAANGIAATTVSLGTAGAHILHIARATGSVSFQGVSCYNSATASVLIWNAGWGGSKAGDWTGNAYAWQPTIIGTTPITPNLTVITLGINDWINGTSISSFTTSLTTDVTNAQRSGDVILVDPFPSNTSSVTQATQNQYRAAIAAVAAATNVPLVDWQGRVVSYAVANTNGFAGGQDSYHPSPTGYADFAAFIHQILQQAVGY